MMKLSSICSVVVAAGLIASPTFGADGKAAAITESQREAMTLLTAMANNLAGLKSFTVIFRDGYDVVQSTGQKIEFGDTRRITLARPRQLRVEEISSDGTIDLTLFDGRNVTVLNADSNVFAQAAQPGTIDDTLVYFVRDLKMRMPLARLLMTRLPADLPKRVRTIDYVESTEINGVPTHHLAGRTSDVDFQYWITEGDRPLPLRVVITYVNAPGQPQFWANFSDWNTSPQLPQTTFQFAPPRGAQKIAFAAQLSQSAGARQPAAPSQEVKP
jgi:hypothetical protein